MNLDQSHTQPSPQSDDEPIGVRDCIVVSALVIAACAGVAISFTAIATCHAVDGVIKRVFKKRDRHVFR